MLQIWGWYQKNELSVRLCLGVVPSFSTRKPSNPISNHIRVAPFPYMVWVTWNMFFLTFLNIYDVDITFRSIKGSMAVFDFNSTSKKHSHATRREGKNGTFILHQKLRTCFFFIFEMLLDLFFSKNRIDVIFWTLDMNMNGDFCWFVMIFIYVSLFQSKGQNSFSESDEYSSYKLINYDCSKISHQIWKLESLSFQTRYSLSRLL